MKTDADFAVRVEEPIVMMAGRGKIDGSVGVGDEVKVKVPDETMFMGGFTASVDCATVSLAGIRRDEEPLAGVGGSCAAADGSFAAGEGV